MSVNMDTNKSTDYSDFSYQQIRVRVAPGNSASAVESVIEAVASVEPLQGQGGLANNEVAELVSHRLDVEFYSADYAGAGDQNVSAGMYLSGAFGANADREDLIPENLEQAGETSIIDNDTTGTITNPVTLQNVTEGRIFEIFQSSASLGFDDGTNGLGGSPSSSSRTYSRNWRSETGRGPVLDQTDDLTFAMKATAFDNVIEGASFIVTVHLVWDVAELSDAGRVFSVPS